MLERWGDRSFHYWRSNNLPSLARKNSLALSRAHAHSLSSFLTSFHLLSNVLSPALERCLTTCRSLFHQLSLVRSRAALFPHFSSALSPVLGLSMQRSIDVSPILRVYWHQSSLSSAKQTARVYTTTLSARPPVIKRASLYQVVDADS